VGFGFVGVIALTDCGGVEASPLLLVLLVSVVGDGRRWILTIIIPILLKTLGIRIPLKSPPWATRLTTPAEMRAKIEA
jgi:hypothetical protein